MRYLSLVCLVVVLVGFVLLFRWVQTSLGQRTITGDKVFFEMEQSDFLDTLAIRKQVLNFVKGARLTDLKITHQIEHALLADYPIIDELNARIELSGSVLVKLSVRKVIARVLNEKGNYYLDRKLDSVPFSSHHTPRVLLISGDFNKKNRDSIGKLVHLINAHPFWHKMVVQISCLSNGDCELLMRSPKQQIILGAVSGLKEKLSNLLAFYKAKGLVGVGRYETIDLKYKNQVVGIKNKHKKK